MSKETRHPFYASKTWQRCQIAYMKSVGGLCEECKAQGRITAAEIVHHKIHITDENINDPEITLNFENLKAVCRECHGKEHRTRERRFAVDEAGRLIKQEDTT